jgi:hypothetical protein
MEWDAVLERLEPLVEAKGEAGILVGVKALRSEWG